MIVAKKHFYFFIKNIRSFLNNQIWTEKQFSLVAYLSASFSNFSSRVVIPAFVWLGCILNQQVLEIEMNERKSIVQSFSSIWQVCYANTYSMRIPKWSVLVLTYFLLLWEKCSLPFSIYVCLFNLEIDVITLSSLD